MARGTPLSNALADVLEVEQQKAKAKSKRKTQPKKDKVHSISPKVGVLKPVRDEDGIINQFTFIFNNKPYEAIRRRPV